MISKEAEFFKCVIRKNSAVSQTLDEARKNNESMKTIVKFPSEVSKTDIEINNVKCELFNNINNDQKKIIVYFHGGGYCLGISDNTRNFAAKISNESGYKTLLVDYRLAPENKYPSAHEDALSVYTYLINNNYKSEDIIMIGDSSGCGLILATLLKAKEMEMPQPKALVLISPLVDYTKTAESLITKKSKDPYNYDNPFSIADVFLENNDVKNCFISPLYGNLTGLPPMLIHGSEDDVFCDDSINLSQKAKESGAHVTLKIWKELWHVFHVSCDIVPEAKEALNEIHQFIDKFF